MLYNILFIFKYLVLKFNNVLDKKLKEEKQNQMNTLIELEADLPENIVFNTHNLKSSEAIKKIHEVTQSEDAKKSEMQDKLMR